MDNPWHYLPTEAPFVLPADTAAVRDFNDRASARHKLRIDDILPEPFVGDPSAPVVLLSNNPGFKAERVTLKLKPRFIERMRDNMRHESKDYPFVFFAPDIDVSHSHWWNRKLNGLLEEFSHDVLAESIFVVEHVPYPSERYKVWPGDFPSQAKAYNFSLVRKAMERQAVLVLMRGRRRWLRDIPELSNYDGLCVLSNPQAGTISRGNCDRFDDIVRAIKAARLRA